MAWRPRCLVWIAKCCVYGIFKLMIFLIGFWKFYDEQIKERHREPKNLLPGEGRRVVITGGNRGIGLEAVKQLVRLGYHVIIGCRDPEKCHEYLTCLDLTAGEGAGSFECHRLDLARMASVEDFARVVNAKHGGIHVLINNAGTMFGPLTKTEDGFELQIATNYIGHFLLTYRLLHKLREGASAERVSRIINVTSAAHWAGAWLEWNDLHFRTSPYTPEKGYGNSKMAQVLFTKYLNEKLAAKKEGYENVTVNCLHPGVVRTGLYDKHVGWMTKLLGWFMKTAKQGGDTVVYAAASIFVGKSKGGLYLENSHPAPHSEFSTNRYNQLKLWEATLKTLKLPDI